MEPYYTYDDETSDNACQCESSHCTHGYNQNTSCTNDADARVHVQYLGSGAMCGTCVLHMASTGGAEYLSLV